MSKYDHSQLKAGDRVAYSDGTGWGGWNQQVKMTTVDRLTTTQIVMKDGKRFRRDTGRMVGSTGNGWLLDPKGETVKNALAKETATLFGYAVTQWEKQRRAVQTLEDWKACLALLEAEIKEAQKEVKRIEKEMA